MIEVSILFILKKNEDFYLYINYRDLNKIIIKNYYFLSLINKTLNRLNNIKRFIKVNLKNIYYRIRI